jgi:hypothetical protein
LKLAGWQVKQGRLVETAEKLARRFIAKGIPAGNGTLFAAMTLPTGQMNGEAGQLICLNWSAVAAMGGQFGGNTQRRRIRRAPTKQRPTKARSRATDHILIGIHGLPAWS